MSVEGSACGRYARLCVMTDPPPDEGTRMSQQQIAVPLLLMASFVFTHREPAHAQDKTAAKNADAAAVLSGRIVDETGAPVTDAELTLQGAAYLKATTDDDGRYAFNEVKKQGEYRIGIESFGWIGLRDYRSLPRVDLTPTSKVTRDFKLQRAGQLEIRAVDEDGIPIRGVSINAASLAANKHGSTESVRTDVDGWAAVGGLKPSDVKYIFGLRHKGFAFAKLIDAIKKPGVADAQTVVMKKGATIKGTAICSDGKPPVGWRILAMPKWWHFGVSPQGLEVAADGTFEFPNIVPGEYDVTISIPRGGGSSMALPVMTGDLLAQPQPLSLKIGYPSPASLTYISGTVVFPGKRPNGFRLFARAAEGTESASFIVRGEETKFKIGPLPPGRYHITTAEPTIEPVDLKDVTAPIDDLTIELKARGKPMLTGGVRLPGGKTPVQKFQLSVVKLRTLSGPSYAQDTSWKTKLSKDGSFSVEVNSSGIYRISVLADGFAATNSVDINTTLKPQPEIKIVLDKGVAVTGTVIDESGAPVAGAVVRAMSLAGRSERSSSINSQVQGVRSQSEPGSVATGPDGKFVFHNLARGKETLQVSCQDFCDTKVDNLDLATRLNEPLKIVMKQGGTIRGLVYDGAGKPASGIVLHFQDSFHGGNYERGRLGSAVSDSRGYYQVDHLPLQQVYITCGDEWKGTGVIRQSVLPQNGKRLTVHFGGPEKLTGRLIVNGTPLANMRIQLGGHNSFSGITKAFAKTNADGEFTFFGAPPGIWSLYHDSGTQRSNDWIRIREVEVEHGGTMDLGDVSDTSGSLTVHSTPADSKVLSQLQFTLSEYDPTWPFGRSAGTLRARKADNDPFVFDHVSPGDFELVCRRQGHVITRQRLRVMPDTLPQTVEFALAEGSGVLIGTMPPPPRDRYRRLNVWSEDGRWHGTANVEADGTFRLENLPAGKWLIRDRDTRNWPPVAAFELQEGEEKTINLTEADGLNRASPDGFGQITAYTSNGVITPCHVTLTGPDGDISERSRQFGRVTFTAPPGEYEATIRLKGFATQTRRILLQPADENGRPAADWATAVTLQEDD